MIDILNMPDWSVIQANETDQEITISAKCGIDQRFCPECSFMILDKHGKLPRKFMDIPIRGKHVALLVQKQRYKCQNCGKTFAQSLPGTDEKRKMTVRLSHYIQEQSINRTFTALAGEVGVNEKTIRNVFHEYMQELDARHQVQLPSCLGIDEIKLDKRFRCVLSNVKDHMIIDMLRNRDKVTLNNYLHKFKDREIVEIICMDMWNPYKTCVHELFPKAAVVVDKFHFLRMANDAVNKIRKHVNSELTSTQRRQLMHDRFLLMRRQGDLEDQERFILDAWLKNFPLLAQAYALKEDLYNIWDLQDRSEAERRFTIWKDHIVSDLFIGYGTLMVAANNWHEEIFAYFDHRMTNAYTESLNGLTKLTNRIGRGYSFEVIRAKMLYGCQQGWSNPQ